MKSLYEKLMSLFISEDNIEDYKKRIKAEEELEQLNEDSIAKYNNYQIGIYGDGSKYRGFDKVPYFKYFYGQGARNCSKLVRVSLLDPEFVMHSGGEPPWNKFSKNDKTTLINMLKKEPKENHPLAKEIDYECKNNWEYMVFEAEKYSRVFNRHIDTESILDKGMPDYNNLPTGNIK